MGMRVCLFWWFRIAGLFAIWECDLVCVRGSAVGGHALKMFRLTVKWGWSVCIIAYNGNVHSRRSGRG